MTQHHSYVATNYKTRVDLQPDEIQKDRIDDFLLQRLTREYGRGRTIKDGNVMGYIRKGSVKLVQRSRGFIVGSHFTGHLTFDVVINFDLYTPTLNRVVQATVTRKTPVAFMAEAPPLRIIIAKTTSFQQDNDLFDLVNPGMLIPIEILHYDLRGNHIFAIGRLREFQENYAKSFEIDVPRVPESSFALFGVPPELASSTTVPRLNEAYGDPSNLNKAKDALADPNDPQKVAYWEYYMKQFLNDYEIIGNPQYYPTNEIYNLSPAPFSRAFYKLLEILKDEEVLREFDQTPISALLLGEAPGGFIQALIETRKDPLDKYVAVTAPVDPADPKGPIRWDWDNNLPEAARTYLQKQKNLTKWNYDLTDPDRIMDIIAYFNSPNNKKADIITADGGIDVETSDNYNWQERLNYKLFYGEILAAIGSQAPGGTFIMKIYDIYTDITNQFLHLLGNLYDTVVITKPRTSRPANSERYIVAKGFRGLHGFPLNEHIDQLRRWNAKEKELQITPSRPFLDRKFYITNLITIQLDDAETTDLIREKNQLLVNRQLKNLEEGAATLRDLRGDQMSDQQKADLIRDRVTKQVQNAASWCSSYLPKDNCKGLPSTIDISYYQNPQGPRDNKLPPLLPATASTRAPSSSRGRGRMQSRASSRGSSRGSSSTLNTRGSSRGRGRGNSSTSARGNTTQRAVESSSASSTELPEESFQDDQFDGPSI
jgi:23S rRNA U2552 (ribose-2'-O)-methylase RlmE/FtsJ